MYIVHNTSFGSYRMKANVHEDEITGQVFKIFRKLFWNAYFSDKLVHIRIKRIGPDRQVLECG
jgi:hypothetical protein